MEVEPHRSFQSPTNQKKKLNLCNNFLYFYFILKLAPDGPPPDISARSDNSSVLDVLWSPVLQENQNGVILGYLIALSDAWGESLRNVTQNSRQTYTQFQGLEPWTNYSVKVSAFTSKGNGPYSASLLANTEEDGRLNNLIILKIMC